MSAVATEEPGTRLQELRGGPVAVLARLQPDDVTGRQLAETFRSLGIAATRVSEAELDPMRCGVICLRGNANWYPHALERLATAPPAERGFVVVWHSEPLPFPARARLPQPGLNVRERAKILLRDRRATDPYTNVRRLRWLARRGLPDLLVVSSAGRQEYLAEIGLRADHVPLGYHPDHGRDLGLERDIDVLFVGALDVPRRRRALRELRRRGVRVEAVGDWSDPRFWGENRTHLINRAKIFLNLSRHEGQFSGERLILGMANRALVVSERMFRPEPFVPGTHYVAASLDEIPGLVERFLADAEAREQVAAAGHLFVTRDLTLGRSVARIVELIDG